MRWLPLLALSLLAIGAKVGSRSPKKRFGSVVLVSPVPLVLGSDAKITGATLILAMAIALTVVLLVLFL